MKTITNKAKITSAFFVVLLIASVALAVLPVQAVDNEQPSGSIPLPAGVTPDLTLTTAAHLSVTPPLLGLGQPLLVNIWLTPAVITSRYMTGYKVTFTKPDESTQVVTIDSYLGDATAWFPYPVDQVGTYTCKFDFLGGYFPPGNYSGQPGVFGGSGPFSFDRSVYYAPSSSPISTFTVQQDLVSSWPASPLPTDYWTRPIALTNREWWPIAGNYPGTGFPGGNTPEWNKLFPNNNPSWSQQYNFVPWVKGCTTPHIVWKQQNAMAGLVGGPVGIYGQTGNPGNPSLIYAGRCYQTMTVQVNGVPASSAVCYDLRTGERYYAIPVSDGGVTPNIVAYVERGDAQMTQSENFYSPAPELLSISGGYLRKVNPLTGQLTSNISIAPMTGSGGTYYMNEYVLGIQDLGSAAGADRYRLINWTTTGTSTNFATRVMSNTTYARSSLPSYIDWGAGYGVVTADISDTKTTLIPNSTLITCYNLYTGAQVWQLTGPPQYISTQIADHGKFAYLNRWEGYFYAYDLATGNLAWTSEQLDYPYREWGAYAIASAYGMIFRGGYNGYYAIDWTNGKIVWLYESPALAPFESPYVDENGVPIYPFNSGCTIADGMLYTYNTEHTPSTPYIRGWSLHCINVTTGERIFRILGSMSPGGIADGYLTGANSYDGYMYVFGQGKTATTVTAPDAAVPLGTTVLIKGTVLDMSPAQEGTPCVSAASMETQMEYLHMQIPIGGIWGNETITGVPVVLVAVDSNGNVINIGTATTDGYDGTFGIPWTPPSEGLYKIEAIFSPDESYGSSSAGTKLLVGPPPAAPEPVEIPTPVDNTMTIVYAAIAIIIAVVISAAVVGILLLRKRS